LAMKAYLRNFGKGTLTYIDHTLKFYVEKGHFTKQRKIIKEIPIVEIEDIAKEKNELSITWKGTTDRFVIEKIESIASIYEEINKDLEEHKKALEENIKALEEKSPAEQAQNNLANTLSASLEVVDVLFDVLRSLQGCVDWKRMAKYAERSEKDFKSLFNQETAISSMEFAPLLSAIKDHNTAAISKEAYHLLKSLYDYFHGLTDADAPIAQVHPNFQEVKRIVQSYYTLNDIILAVIVKDEKIGEEINQLEIMLSNLSAEANLALNIEEIVNTINKLRSEDANEKTVGEFRAIVKNQLKTLLAFELPKSLPV
jgi:hypothetical protein